MSSDFSVDPTTRSGDPFYAAAIARAHDGRRDRRRGCSLCFGGYVTITVEEDGQEHDEAVPCRRCSDYR